MIAALGLFFSNTWAKALPYLLIVGAVLAVLIGFYERGKSAGRAAIEANQQKATIRAQQRNANDIRTSISARDAVRALPASRLRDHDEFERR